MQQLHPNKPDQKALNAAKRHQIQGVLRRKRRNLAKKMRKLGGFVRGYGSAIDLGGTDLRVPESPRISGFASDHAAIARDIKKSMSSLGLCLPYRCRISFRSHKNDAKSSVIIITVEHSDGITTICDNNPTQAIHSAKSALIRQSKPLGPK